MTPVTNPTSTVINKALIGMKTRNPVIFCPHKAAKKCARKAAEIAYQAALTAGAPEGCIQWTTKSNWSYTEALMRLREAHPAEFQWLLDGCYAEAQEDTPQRPAAPDPQISLW